MRKAFPFIAAGVVIIGGVGLAVFMSSWGQAQTLAFGTPVEITGMTEAASAAATVTYPPTNTPFQPATHTLTSTATPTLTLTPSPTSTPSPSPTPTATLTPTLPTEARIEGIQGRWPAFSLDCEARSAVDWAAYFRVQINEIAFFNNLPVSDDPDLGFVGDVHAPWGQTPPRPYGVHAEPVAALLRDYGLSAQARHGMAWDELRAEIAAGRPMIVWVVGRVGRGTPIPYTTSAGNKTVVARFEHTVIVIGYTERDVTVLDGNWVYTRLVKDFVDSWGVLGNMAVLWE